MATKKKVAPTAKSSRMPRPKPKSEHPSGPAASKLIDARIAELTDWRGAMLAKVRAVILGADQQIIEEWKWGIPVWSRNGILCTGEVYKATVKLTFAKGANMKDPAKLFNSSLEGNTRRAIDLREGDALDEGALADLIRTAATHNAVASRR
ncbi:MAG: DUF1801 domain-containing protein [Myxococcaceae bacterium]